MCSSDQPKRFSYPPLSDSASHLTQDLPYHLLLDCFEEWIHVVNSEGIILYMNKAFRQKCKSLNINAEYVGRHLMAVFPFLESDVIEEYRKVFDHGLTVETRDEILVDNAEYFTETEKIPVVKDGEIVAVITVIRDLTDIVLAEKERENLIIELKEAVKTIDALEGLIPICASCKKVRDDEGFWHQVEHYLSKRSSATFTHGICPDCKEKVLKSIHKP